MQSIDDLAPDDIRVLAERVRAYQKKVRDRVESRIAKVIGRYDLIYHPTALTMLARLLRTVWTNMMSIEVIELVIPRHTSITVDAAFWESNEARYELREMIAELCPGWTVGQVGQKFLDNDGIEVYCISFAPFTGYK